MTSLNLRRTPGTPSVSQTPSWARGPDLPGAPHERPSTPARHRIGYGALLALTACEKPAPIVTVVSGGESEYTEATTFCFDDQTLESGACATRAEGPTTVEVRGGETVGVDVDGALVDDGWFIELSDPAAQGEQQQQPQRSEPQNGHYFTFTAPNLQACASLRLTVRSLGESGEPNGEWAFDLKPKR